MFGLFKSGKSCSVIFCFFCWVVEHSGAHAVLPVFTRQYFKIHTTLASFPEFFVISQLRVCHWLVAEIEPDLVEWNYGDYEGRRGADIRAKRPDWQLFRDGCPGGESPQQVAARADRVVDRLRGLAGDVLLFSSGHFLRVLAARWVGIETFGARSFMLSTASLSALGYEHSLEQPAIQLWNETHHLLASYEQNTDANSLLSHEVTR